MFKEYDATIKKLLISESTETDWKKVLESHREMIAIIQHERLIHLLVTIFVGLAMLFTSLAAIITEKLFLLVLSFPLLILFMAYIFHYWFLENTTQKWYKIEDEIKSRMKD